MNDDHLIKQLKEAHQKIIQLQQEIFRLQQENNRLKHQGQTNPYQIR